MGVALMAGGACLVLLGVAIILVDVRSEVAYHRLAAEVREANAYEAGEWAGGTTFDWDALWRANGDVVGWITVDGTAIDHPVVRGEDNAWYLTHDLWGRWSETGCPFLDCRADPDMGVQLIFGHHMGVSREMFSELHDVWNQDSFDRLGACTWATPADVVELHPLCAARVDQDHQLIQRFAFASPDELHEWLSNLCEKACARVSGWEDVATRASRVVSLVTCSSDIARQRARTIVIFVA